MGMIPPKIIRLLSWFQDNEPDEPYRFPIDESGTLDPPQGVSAIIPLPNGYTPLVEPTPDAFPLHYRSPCPGTIVAREEPHYEQPMIEYPKL